MHVTDNQGVAAIFQIGSPVEPLQKMAVKVYMAANRLNITLFFIWRPRNNPLMVIVDKGSRGPWLDFDDFSLDAEAISEVKNRGINLDSFASFHNRVVDRFFSLGYQVESSGMNFLTQRLTPSDVVLIHTHPLMLFDALLHASYFNCKVVALMHLWAGYPSYKNLLLGGHLPLFCENLKVTKICFKDWSPAPAFSGVRNFQSAIFNILFSGNIDLVKLLQSVGSMRGECLLGGCHVCTS